MDEVETQQQRMDRILEISRELTSTVSLELLLRKIVEAATELTDSEVASILLLDEHTGELRFIAAKVLADQLADIPVPVNASIAGIAFSSGKPQVVSDARTDPRYYKGVEEQIGFEARSLLAVPLQFKDRRIGVLEVANKQDDEEFNQEDVETLTVLAAQATVAIENARLVEALQESHDESERQVEERTVELSKANTALKQQIADRTRAEETLQRRNQELSVLLDTAQALSTTLRLDRLLERALDELRRVVPYDTALIGMLRDEHWWIAASRSHERASPKRFDLEELPLVQQVVRERGPVIVPDVRQEPNWFPVEGAEWIRSWLGVPLISRDEVVGVLMVNSRHPYTYDKEIARLASTFAHHVALAIENSRLYEQVRMRLREATLLHSVTMALSSTLDIDQILPYVTRSLCEILNATSAEIYILDEEVNAITLIANYVVPVGNQVEEERRSSLGQTYAMTDLSAAMEALTRRTPLQVQANDPEVDPRLLAGLETHDAQAMLLLPMVVGDSILGFSQVWDSQALRRFTESEIATGQMLIHQATITIDNARLVEALRQRTNELQARNEELDAFAHTVAHDLKSPLSSIIGFGSFLEQTFTQMSDQAMRDNLQMITQSGQKMNTIIEELLLLAS
ncbi:MAG: GAF domain-containing protein, partial [Anaerolineae bacterium]